MTVLIPCSKRDQEGRDIKKDKDVSPPDVQKPLNDE